MKRRTFLRHLITVPATSLLSKAKTEQRTTIMDSAIAGAYLYDAPTHLNQLTICQPLILKPEPSNQYDKNAVEIHTESGLKLGYVPRTSSRYVTGLLYDIHGIKAELSEISFNHTIDDPQLRFRLFVEKNDLPLDKLISRSDMSLLQILHLPAPHKFELLEKRFFWILENPPNLEDDASAAEYYFGGFLFNASFDPPDMVECFLSCGKEADKILQAFVYDDDLLDSQAPGNGRIRGLILDFLEREGKHDMLNEICRKLKYEHKSTSNREDLTNTGAPSNVACNQQDADASPAKPLIAINCEYDEDAKGKSWLRAFYYKAVSLAGGIPILLPIITDESDIEHLLRRIDGLVLSGGSDINPAHYNETIHQKTKLISPEREQFDFALVRKALDLDKPILAVCYGAQLVNVILGGSLIQDIPSQCNTQTPHRGEKKMPLHNVSVRKGTKLYEIIGSEELEVNSSHHQAIKQTSNSMIVNAVADGNVIEGAESNEHSFVMAVQWHPERLTDREEHLRLFQALVEVARRTKTGKFY